MQIIIFTVVIFLIIDTLFCLVPSEDDLCCRYCMCRNVEFLRMKFCKCVMMS